METNRHLSAALLFDLIYRPRPLDRQVILLYLEGEAAVTVAEATGLTAMLLPRKYTELRDC